MVELTPRIVPVAVHGNPQAVYTRLGCGPGTALLESSLPMPGLGEWSFIAGPARATLRTDASGQTRLSDTDGSPLGHWDHPFDALHALLPRSAPSRDAHTRRSGRPAGLPFAGGWVGHLAYDLGRFVERLPSRAAVDPLPVLCLHWADHVLAFDHRAQQWYFCCTPHVPWSPAPASPARERVWADSLARALAGDAVHNAVPAAAAALQAGRLQSRTGNAAYLDQVQTILAYIAAGDIFQANLSHRIEANWDGDPFALYQRLCTRNPAPFGAYLPGDDYAIASVSPERFLHCTPEGQVTARPIKGTLARGATPQADARAHAQLSASTKDRAENVMIVDLMRNDLGRVARTGSVSVPKLFELEAHPSVWQMVSTVQAVLRDGATPVDLLRACWPPGSMTGAPKVRAMEIIESLEPTRRGVYAGSIGYFDVAGGLDLSVVIRTAVVQGGRVSVQVGGAVVADSQPQAELDETYAKGQRLLEVLGAAPHAVA